MFPTWAGLFAQQRCSSAEAGRTRGLDETGVPLVASQHLSAAGLRESGTAIWINDWQGSRPCHAMPCPGLLLLPPASGEASKR